MPSSLLVKKPPVVEVLERRIVASGATGRSEWQLVKLADNTTEWRAAMLDDKGSFKFEPVWMPLPGSQWLFLESPVYETLYAGTRGPGKTLSLIMDFAKDCNKGYGSNWRGILFRKHFPDLDDAVRKIEEWMPKIFPGFVFLKSKSDYKALWPDGEALLLRNMPGPEGYDDYHGHEYPWIGWEELTQWEDDKAYKLMFSCSRPTAPGIPTRIRATTNPYGVGHGWVKKRFQLPGMFFKVIRGPGEMPRIAIHGDIHENFLLLHTDPNYLIKVLQAAKNPAQKAAWINGSWDVTSGGMIDDLWNDKVHIVPNIPVRMIPHGWTISRAYDHGQSHPFAVGWWLESNGEPIEVADGRLVGEVRGDLILWMEWYGTNGGANEGLRMASADIAQGILDREEDEGISNRVIPGPADNQIYNKDADKLKLSIAGEMEEVGVYWETSDKSSGSRKRGWQLLRNYLTNAAPKTGYREKPGLFVCERCVYWLELMKPLPRDEKDLDEVPESYEDHHADQTRYRIGWSPPVIRGGDF